MRQLNLGSSLGVAVREYPTDTGPADYVLFVNRQAVGIIEAKRDESGENLTVAEVQTERYANATLKWRMQTTPLPFLFEATSQIIRFTDGRDPVPRSREIFHFYKPEQLAQWLAQTETLRRRLREKMPELPLRNLRDCQVSKAKPNGYAIIPVRPLKPLTLSLLTNAIAPSTTYGSKCSIILTLF